MPNYASTDNQQAFRCPRCDGSGKVKVGKDDQEREVDCSICGGAGRVTAARMASYQGTPDAVQNATQELNDSDKKARDSNSESSKSEESGTLFDLLDSKISHSTAAEDILKGSNELPDGVQEEEFADLIKQELVVCPRCSGMKQVFLKGKRSPCPVCNGLGVTSSQHAKEWRKGEVDNDDRFKPRA